MKCKNPHCTSPPIASVSERHGCCFRCQCAGVPALLAQLAEWPPIIDKSARIIGSDFRNSGVVEAALDWQEQQRAALLARIERLERACRAASTFAQLYDVLGDVKAASVLEEIRFALKEPTP